MYMKREYITGSLNWMPITANHNSFHHSLSILWTDCPFFQERQTFESKSRKLFQVPKQGLKDVNRAQNECGLFTSFTNQKRRDWQQSMHGGLYQQSLEAVMDIQRRFAKQ